MKLASFILLVVLCVGMGVIYTIFHKRYDWQGLLVRGLTILSLLALAIVAANLKELNNALPIFFILALGVLFITETIKTTQKIEGRANLIIYSVLSFASTTLLAVGAITLSQFNILSLVGGILTGVGLGLIVCAVKKDWSVWSIVMEVLVWLSVGLLLGFAMTAVLTSKHLLSSVFMLLGAVFMLAYKLIEKFASNNKVFEYISNALYVLSLLLLTITIYLF